MPALAAPPPVAPSTPSFPGPPPAAIPPPPTGASKPAEASPAAKEPNGEIDKEELKFSADLEALAEEAPETPQPAPKKTPDKTASKSPVPLEKPAPKLTPAKAEPAAPAPASVPKTTPELRAAYEHAKAELDKAHAELETFKKPAQKENPEAKALSEQLDKEAKLRTALEDRIRLLDYSQSEEFRAKYEQPYEESYKDAWARLKELPKADGSGTLTENELSSLLFSDEERAYDQIEGMFEGSKRALAQRLVQKVYGLSETKNRALRDAREKAAERQKERSATETLQRTRLSDLFSQHNKELSEKYPMFFGPDETDPEGNTLLESGYKLADMAFHGSDQLTPEQMVRVHAEVRHRAAAFGRSIHRIKKLETQNAELLDKLKAYENKEPAGDDTAAERIDEDDLEAQLNKLATDM